MPTVWQLIVAALANAGVGLLIGWSGIAGFLLPLLYVGYLGLSVPESLALSFCAFAVSGIIGAAGYHRHGNLPMPVAMPLATGSLVGAVLGVVVSNWIPPGAVKVMLYAVVLLSGASILVRERRIGGAPKGNNGALLRSSIAVALGFGTAVICALSGAGGPILVMPLLVVLGVEVRQAIGIALFDSIFIALPSIVGYGARSKLSNLLPFLVVGCLAHAAGVVLGSRTCHHIPQKPLKMGVAVFSISLALYMIAAALI